MKATLRIAGCASLDAIEEQVRKVNEELALLRQMVRDLTPHTVEIELYVPGDSENKLRTGLSELAKRSFEDVAPNDQKIPLTTNEKRKLAGLEPINDPAADVPLVP